MSERYKAHEGFVRVTPTADELEEWRRRYPRRSTRQYRLQCEKCGKRIWGSGLGIGSHRRGCKGDHGPSQAEFDAALDAAAELRRVRIAGEASEEHPNDLMRVPGRPNRLRKHLDGLHGVLIRPYGEEEEA